MGVWVRVCVCVWVGGCVWWGGEPNDSGRRPARQKGLLKAAVRDGQPVERLRAMLDNLQVLPDDEAESGLDTLLFPMLPDDATHPALSPVTSARVSPGACEVYVVRHGERLDEVAKDQLEAGECGEFDRWFDPPLTRRGGRQAAAAAVELVAALPEHAVGPSPMLPSAPPFAPLPLWRVAIGGGGGGRFDGAAGTHG